MRISKSDLKLLRSLAQKKVRDRERKFVVEGWKPLRDALNSDFQTDFVAIVESQAQDPDHSAFLKDIDARGIPRKELTDLELQQVTGTVHAQGIVAVARQRRDTIDEIMREHPALLVLADRIADPGNLGTIVRTCDWFGVDALILGEGCVDLYNEKVVRSTSGSIFHVRVADHVPESDALSKAKASGFKIVVTAADSNTSYTDANFGKKNLIILGNEASGVQPGLRRLADAVVGIPRQGKAESLNVGVACGIILSYLSRRR